MTLDRKVLFVNHTAQLGGAELSLIDLAARTPGCSVALFADGGLVERLGKEGVDVKIIDAPALKAIKRDTKIAGGLLALRGIWQSVRAVARIGRNYDLLYANSQKGWVATALASKLCRKPAVWHLRDMLTADHFSKVNIRVVVGLANRFASLVIANSQATADSFIEAGGRPSLVKVIYNGIDPTRFPKREPKTDRSFEDNKPVVGCVARLCEWKGQHIFLDAIAKVPGVRGWVIGAALFGEDEYAEGLKKQAESLGISDRVEFLGFRSDIPELLSKCDIVAHAATSPEPFGRVIVEAMLSGAAVVATEGGGPSEIITHQDTGLLVPPGDSDALADAIRLLSTDADQRDRLADKGLIYATEHYALNHVVRQVHEQIKQITGQTKPGAA